MATRTAEHTLKMGMGQVKNAASKASPEELVALRETALRQINEFFGPGESPAVTEEAFTEAHLRHFEAQDTPDAPAVLIEEAPQQADGEYIDHSSFRRNINDRIESIQELIARSTNERQIGQLSGEIQKLTWCIDRSLEADQIPVHKTKWGNDGLAKGLKISVHDMLDSPRPIIAFSVYAYETDRPFRIAVLSHYQKNRRKGDIPIFEVPLDHEAYCDNTGQFMGFDDVTKIKRMVDQNKAKWPLP